MVWLKSIIVFILVAAIIVFVGLKLTNTKSSSVFKDLPNGNSVNQAEATSNLLRANGLLDGKGVSTSFQTEGDWTIGFATITDRADGSTNQEAIMVLGHFENKQWVVALSGSTTFQKWLPSVPSSLMSEETKSFYSLK